MVKEAWTKRERTTARLTSPTGEAALIRPIDPEFWSEDGNIELFKYFKEHDEYLNKHQEENGIVYHYTNLAALHGIAKEGAIWASDVRHLNDRAELKYALENMRALLVKGRDPKSNQQPIDAIFRPGLTGQFVTCLSRSRDQLSQWRAYGERIGIAIAFDREHLTRAVNAQAGIVVDCQYRGPDEFVGLRGDLESILGALKKPGALNTNGELIDMALQDELTQRVVQIATSIKHPSFLEEQEVRLVFSVKAVSDTLRFRSSHQSLTPYMKIDIWPAPGSEDTELGVLMEREVRHGTAEVHAGVQA